MEIPAPPLLNDRIKSNKETSTLLPRIPTMVHHPMKLSPADLQLVNSLPESFPEDSPKDVMTMVKKMAQLSFSDHKNCYRNPSSEEESDCDEEWPRIAKSNSYEGPSTDKKKWHHKENLRRRCFSCPQVAAGLEERRLQMRRSVCESVVQQLYENRKERIMEIFENRWFLSDILEDMD